MSRELFLPEDDVILGWNDKINASSLELSGLVPFVNLISLIDLNDIFDIDSSMEDAEGKNAQQRQALAARFSRVNITNDVAKTFGDENVNQAGVFLAGVESQLESVNKKGGVGINSLDVTRGTKEAFNERFDVSMTFTDPEIFDTNLEYSSLIILNSVFLIMYGWSGGKGLLFKDSPPITFDSRADINVDLQATNGGFWTATLARLYKFDFNFDQTGQINATLGLMAPHNATLTFMRSAQIAEKMKNNLKGKNDTISTHFFSDHAKEKRDKNIELLKPVITVTVVSINKITDENNKVVEVPVKEDVETYYYLGWVLEALRDAVNSKMTTDRSDNMHINFRYLDIEDSRIDHLYKKIYRPPNLSTTTNSEDVFITDAAQHINNVFEVPLKKHVVDDIMQNKTMPVLDMIKFFLAPETHDLPGVQLATREKNNALEIFVANVDMPESKQMLDDLEIPRPERSTTLYIEFGNKDSLVESIDLTSKLDPNAHEVYKIPVPLGDTVEDLRRDLKGTNLNSEIERILSQTDDAGEKIATTPAGIVSKLIEQDIKNYRIITQALLKDQDIFARLMGKYLKRTTVQMHGTTGLNAYNAVVVRGMIKKLSGIYNIIQITEQLNKSSFNTILEATMIQPFTK